MTTSPAGPPPPPAGGGVVSGSGPPPPPPPGVVPRAGGGETPPTPELKNLWSWAKGYIQHFGWALAPVWMSVDAVPAGGTLTSAMHGCCCKDGEACTVWGKHLVSGLGVARTAEDVDKVWPATDVRVRSGWIGIAVLTGSESKTMVLDVGESSALTRARFKISGHILTQSTPTGGQHWFFRLGDGEAVTGGRTEVELVSGVWVLGDGAFAVLGPRRSYSWVGGSKVLVEAGLTDPTDALRMALANEDLIGGIEDISQDAPWRTRPGTPLVGGPPRSYTRRGDVRRLVDVHGDKMLYTPGLGWKVWTESGWGGAERSETMLRSYVMDLPDVHRTEASQHHTAGKDTLKKDALKWATKSEHRATTAIVGELEAEERVLVPSANDWDSEGFIAGLPVTAGVGRLVDLRTGEIVLDARTRRVSKSLGASYDDGPGGDLKLLWEQGEDGGPGRWFVKYLTDLEDQMGADRIRLLQRAAGASLYGRRGVSGDTDAVFVLKGPPRSGKSTFAECLLKIAGQYGKSQNHNLLFGDRGNPEFTDAAIFGYRVMTLSEPPMHAPLNTTKLKQLSGGDSITGRLPYSREEISFTPECSLWLMSNHALEIADEAVWRRMKFFPFEHSWEGGSEQPELRAALTSDPAELRLALTWMLDGAKAWEREGWGDVSAWNETTREEKARHSPVEKWLTDVIEVTRSTIDGFTHAEMLTSFTSWAAMMGEDTPRLSTNALRDELEGALVRAGMSFDKHSRRMVGGRIR